MCVRLQKFVASAQSPAKAWMLGRDPFGKIDEKSWFSSKMTRSFPVAGGPVAMPQNGLPVGVALGVTVGDGVSVGDCVGVWVGVLTGVAVPLGLGVAVALGDAVGAEETTTSWGGCAGSSRDATLAWIP